MLNTLGQVFLVATLALPGAASAQSGGGGFPSRNLDVTLLGLSDCYEVGDQITFEVITRLASGGATDFAVGNIDYSFNLGGATIITFTGVNADGSFSVAPSSTNGSVSVTMVDVADAGNDLIPSTSASDPGTLISQDTLDRPEAGVPWEADWVFEVVWTVPAGTAPGFYEITGSEVLDVYERDPDTGEITTFPNNFTIPFPNPGETGPQFEICAIPETSSTLLLALSALFVAARRRR